MVTRSGGWPDVVVAVVVGVAGAGVTGDVTCGVVGTALGLLPPPVEATTATTIAIRIAAATAPPTISRRR
jgi:hypothetical protein